MDWGDLWSGKVFGEWSPLCYKTFESVANGFV